MNLLLRLSNAKQRAHVVAKASACAMLMVVLSSCGIPALRSPDPGPVLPPEAPGSANAENSSQVPIEEFFDDPTLTNLIGEALTRNQQLKIMNEDVMIAANVVLARSGAYLPFVSLGANAGANKPSLYTPEGAVDNQLFATPGQVFPNPLPNYLMAANITWQIDVWRQLRNARDAAGQRFFSSAEGRNYLVTRLVAEIAENYYSLMALDRRLEVLDNIIQLQEQSLRFAIAKKEAAKGTELAVQRFLAEVRKNQSEKLIVRQEIIEVENRINYLLGRYPQPVPRMSTNFIDLNLHALNVGVPSQLLRNRPDIREAEREIVATGLDIKVARARFYPVVAINAGVGYSAFNPRYLLITPEALIANVVGDLLAPFINKRAIRADYKSANARQLQAIYNYQRVVVNAFAEVVNRVTMVENYRKSIEIKRQQVKALEASVDNATKLFQNAFPEVDYMDVLFAQRDLMDARSVLINTKRLQLSAIVNAYQALGGGLISNSGRVGPNGPNPFIHTVRPGDSFRSISRLYYDAERYHKALWMANKKVVPDPEHLIVDTKIIIPRIDQLDPALIEPPATPTPAKPTNIPGIDPMAIPPPSANNPGPFGPMGTGTSAPPNGKIATSDAKDSSDNKPNTDAKSVDGAKPADTTPPVALPDPTTTPTPPTTPSPLPTPNPPNPPSTPSPPNPPSPPPMDQ